MKIPLKLIMQQLDPQRAEMFGVAELQKKFVPLSQDINLYPSLADIFPAAPADAATKIFPLMSVSLSHSNPAWQQHVHFFEHDPGVDSISYQIDEKGSIISMDLSGLQEMESVPEPDTTKQFAFLPIEIESAAVLKTDVPLESLDIKDPAQINYRQWAREEYRPGLRSAGVQDSSLLGYLGGVPSFVQSSTSQAGWFVGQIYSYRLGGIGLHCYLFFDPATNTVTQFNQMT